VSTIYINMNSKNRLRGRGTYRTWR